MDIYYVNSKNEIAYLDRYPFKMLSDTSLFDYEWGYETKRNNRIKNIKKFPPDFTPASIPSITHNVPFPIRIITLKSAFLEEGIHSLNDL